MTTTWRDDAACRDHPELAPDVWYPTATSSDDPEARAAIEREDEYLPLIVSRIHRRRDPVAAIQITGDDMGLFAHMEGESA